MPAEAPRGILRMEGDSATCDRMAAYFSVACEDEKKEAEAIT